MIAAVEWDKLLEVVWVSLAAGVSAMVLFSLVVFGSSRAAEARRGGHNPAAYAVLAVVGLSAFLGIVVLALVVILNK